MGYGKAKYGSDQKFQKTGKPGKGPGNNFIRVMPPMHSLADEGKWALYFTTHWGYAGVHPSDGTKTVVRPFRCIEDKDRRSGMVRQACPECDNFRAKEAEANALEADLKKKGLDAKAIKEDPDMKAFNDWLSAHAPERKWYVNVKYKDGTFGDYKINHRTHKKGIDAKIAELLDNQQIDALDPDQGVWFNIKRLGDGFTTPDVIEVEMKMEEATIGGRVKMVPVVALAPLTEEEQARGLKECRDLATLGGSLLTEEQIYALVQSDGTPEAVDKVFGARPQQTRTQASRPVVVEDREDPETREDGDGVLGGRVMNQEQLVTKLAASGANVTDTKTGAPAITPEMKAKAEAILAKKKAEAEAKAKAEAAAKRAADAVKAAKAAEKAAQEAPPPAAEAPAGENPMNMSDDDFLAFFNSQQA